MVFQDRSLSQIAAELTEERWLEIAKMSEMGLSLAAIVHQARQPLSAVKMALQLLHSAPGLNADGRAYLSNALDQAGRLERLLEQARDFLKPSSGEATAVNLGGLIQDVVALLSLAAKTRHIETVCNINPAAPSVLADRDKLEQLLFNLITNARDAVDAQSGGTIRVICEPRTSGGARIVVADDGPGIPASLAEKVFEPFFTTKGPARGTGLGLFVAQRLAAQLGGRVFLLSETERQELGKGRLSTAFALDLPAAPAPKSAAPEPASVKGVALIVDDDRATAEMIAKIARQEGLETVVAFSGEQAVMNLDRQGFAFLIVDVNLPGITGMEVARLARNKYRRMPILVITGEASASSARETAALGSCNYAVKPLDAQTVVSLIRKMRERSSTPPPDAESVLADEDRTAEVVIKTALENLQKKRDSVRREQVVVPRRDIDMAKPSTAPASRVSLPQARSAIPTKPIASRAAPAPETASKTPMARPISTPPPSRGSRDPDASATPSLSAKEIATRIESLRLAVVVIETEQEVRNRLVELLSRTGCAVAGFASPKQAELHIQMNGADILVARPAMLQAHKHWYSSSSGRSPLIGAVAITDAGGVDQAIEAIHLGARGLIAPPFTESSVLQEFYRAVSRLTPDRPSKA